MQKNYTVYDKSEVFNHEVKPYISKIKDICVREKIPFFTTFAVANTDEGGTRYSHTGNFTGSTEIHLGNDFLKKILMLFCGSKLLPPTNTKMYDEVTQDLYRDNYDYGDTSALSDNDDTFDEDLDALFDDNAEEYDYEQAAITAINTKKNKNSAKEMVASEDNSDVVMDTIYIGDL